MRFYSNSTEMKGQEPTVPVIIRATQPNQIDRAAFEGQPNIDIFRYSQYCQDLIQVTAALNIELLRNNHLIELSIALADQVPQASNNSQDGSLKESQDNSTASRKNGSESNMEGQGRTLKENNVVKPSRVKRRKIEVSSQDQYQP